MHHLRMWIGWIIYVCGLSIPFYICGLGMSHGFKNASQQNIGVKCAQVTMALVRVCIHHSTPYPIRAL